MIFPPLLRAGDEIGLVAPGRGLEQTVVDEAIKAIASWGYVPRPSRHLRSGSTDYFSAPDTDRAADLQSLLDNPRIRAILCLRGGYGTTRILDNLSFEQFIRYPKWIVGFSDITALHLRVFRLGVASIHGTMPLFFGRAEHRDSLLGLRSLLSTGGGTMEAPRNNANKNGSATGTLVGGNLSMLVDSIGTSSELLTTDAILAIEETDEPKYRIDRMLMHLLRAGKFNGVRGLVLGQFTAIGETSPPFGKDVEDLIRSCVPEGAFPVAFGFSFGHGAPNLAWVHGAEATLDVNASGACLAFGKT